MNFAVLLEWFGNSIYGFQAILGLWGVYALIFALRQIRRRRFRSEKDSEAFLNTLRQFIEEGEYDSAVALCDLPQNVFRSLPVLARAALMRRHLAPSKLKQYLAAKFDREIVSPIETLRGTIDTVAKSAPMLGLLGTVAGMIAAFSEIGSAQKVNTTALANNISFALITTAVGLVVAIPMILASSNILVRLRSLEDATVEGLQIILEDLEAASTQD